MIAESTKTVKTAVRYDRRRRQWLTVNGRVTDHPSKQAALLAALRTDHPELAAVVTDISRMHDNDPALLDRLLKASQLLCRGHVYADGKVKSQTSEQVYRVSCAGEPCTWSCNCGDFNRMDGGYPSDYGKVCKHCLAALLAEFVGWPVQNEPIPF